MNYSYIVRSVGRIMCVLAAFMLPAMLISLCHREIRAVIAFAAAILMLLAIGLPSALKKLRRKQFYWREGFVTVAAAWIVVSIFGAVPYYASGAIGSAVNSIFESVSGFTTTGASIVADVEALPRGILYWRSFTLWLGGMGVLLFVLALGPSDMGAGNSFYLFRAESPGPSVRKLVPKLRDSAKILYLIYISITIAQILLLVIGRVPLFDAVNIAFSTAGTGGFAIKNDSIISYSTYAQNVTAVFMVICGINFTLFYFIISREFLNVFKDEELRVYFIIILVSIALVTVNIYPVYDTLWQALQHAAFQVTSVISSSGISTADYTKWPGFSHVLFLVLMVIGSSAGSTGCGIKISRLIIMAKSMRASIRNAISPASVNLIYLNGELVDEEIQINVSSFMLIYIATVAVSSLVISLNGFDLETTVSSVLATINNTGIGLGEVGPESNYVRFSDLSKLAFCVNMLLGRLEFYPVLVLLSPSTWRK